MSTLLWSGEVFKVLLLSDSTHVAPGGKNLNHGKILCV